MEKKNKLKILFNKNNMVNNNICKQLTIQILLMNRILHSIIYLFLLDFNGMLLYSKRFKKIINRLTYFDENEYIFIHVIGSWSRR